MLSTFTVDIGTTSVKLCVFDELSTLVASGQVATPTVSDEYGEVYDVEALHTLIAAFLGGLNASQRESISRVSIAAVGESGGLVRSDTTLASPLILWHDHRGAPWLRELDSQQRERVYEVSGLPVNPNYGLSKIAWSLAHAGDEADDAQWLNVAEYIAAWLTGSRWSEYSLASRTSALDLTTKTWSDEIVSMLGIETSVLPQLRQAGQGSPIDAVKARALGLGAGITVHVAGHDHMVGGIGADLGLGETLNSTGTTEGLLFLAAQPRLDAAAAASKLANGIHCDGELYTLFASIPTGGSAFATLQGLTGLDTAQLTSLITRLTERYRSGAIDLRRIPLVLPQFRGSPPPVKQAAARGLMAGVGTDTTVDEVVFGTFLGLAMQYLDVLELFNAVPSRVKVIGPASRNPLWLLLKADLLGVPLSVSRFPEVVSKGAQALASREIAPWAECSPSEVQPDSQRVAALTNWRADTAAMWNHLKSAPV